MRRIFGPHAYGPGPVERNFWARKVPDAELMRPPATGQITTDVAIIGGGFTGLSAALHLAQAGASVTMLEAAHPGWGASGRNGGFCCLGGAKAGDAQLRRRFGEAVRAQWRRTEVQAIALVQGLLDTHKIDADTHSQGETVLAHSPRAMREIEASVGAITRDYGVQPELHDTADLARRGMSGPFHGGLTVPIGFALNPRKYLRGLLTVAEAAGACIHAGSAVTRIDEDGQGVTLSTDQAKIRAGKVILATNGYSSEDIPPWMAARYMPAQSNVLVTRPLSIDEQQQAGWTSRQMAFDSRHLLHYFRLMPDGRFLFGRRGGLLSSRRADAAADRTTRAHFDAMFPAWRGVEAPFAWSGMVCLAASLVPYCGPLPGTQHLLAGFAYHGNGVAMGSYTGALLADLALGHAPRLAYPDIMKAPPKRFPLGALRRVVMPAVYAGAAIKDRWA